VKPCGGPTHAPIRSIRASTGSVREMSFSTRAVTFDIIETAEGLALALDQVHVM
jgi:hypothetical protein